MKKIIQILLITAIAIVFNGCIFLNERGVSMQYYNDCKEYYDANGVYHKSCPHNIIDWK